MAWQYLPSDRALIDNGLRLKLRAGKSGDTRPFGCSGHPTSSGIVNFQFPPKITTDSRKGTWEESELRGTEPVAVFSTSGPRELTLKTTYIVDGHGNNGRWNIDKITKQIRTLRGYFALVRDEGSARENLIVNCELWCILPIAGGLNATGRIKSVDVKYGDTMVYPPGNPTAAFYLRSDVTIDFRLWTKAANKDDAEDVQDIDGLRDRSNPAWY